MHSQHPLHDSTFFFVGPYDDNLFCRGPQLTKLAPLRPTLNTTNLSSKPASTFTASPISDDDEDDFAVLGDNDEHSDDELPRSPRRRHSGAMSISQEDLPYCYDREALRRDTAAHRARHQQRMQKLKAKGVDEEAATFVTHEEWDSEVDGPHMALWVPEGARAAREEKRKRGQDAMPPVSRQRKNEGSVAQRHSSEMDGPMMALWGI